MERLDDLEDKFDRVFESREAAESRMNWEEETLQRIQKNVEEELRKIAEARKELKDKD